MQTILLCAAFAYGIFTIQRPGFLLGGAMVNLPTLWKKLPKGLHEPLFACGVCTSSIWGGLCYIYLHLIPSHWAYFLPIVIVACAGIQSVLDRAVKAFEKHYGYKPPVKADISKQWDYLLPYVTFRTMMVNQFIQNAFLLKRRVIEIGGYHSEWAKMNEPVGTRFYSSFDKDEPFGKKVLEGIFVGGQKLFSYDVVILGLAYDGDLRDLKKLIEGARNTFIEYSDDGISRQQIELLTEGMNVKMVVPEFEINVKDAPAQCGTSVTKRKILVIKNDFNGKPPVSLCEKR